MHLLLNRYHVIEMMFEDSVIPRLRPKRPPPPSAPVSTPRRRFTNVCLDNICGYLVELQSLSPNSALQQTIGNFKALQSKLQKVH